MYGFGSSKPRTAGMTQLRQRQIDSLQQRHQTNLRVIAAGAQYEISVPGTAVVLRIYLPPTFPQVAPVLSAHGPQGTRVVHSHVADNGVIAGVPSISQWQPQKSLDQVVRDVMQQLTASTPRVVELPRTVTPYGQAQGQGQMPPSYTESIRSEPVARTVPRPSAAQMTMQPTVPQSFPALELMTTDELKTLLNDDVVFQTFIDDLECVKSVKSVRDDLLNGNEQQAQENVRNAENVQALQAAINALQEELTEKRRKLEETVKQQQAIMNRLSPEVLSKKLSEAADDAERQSEELANTFLAGDIGLRHFGDEFMALRRLYHCRLAKREGVAGRGAGGR